MGADKWLNCRLRDIQVRLFQHGRQISLPVISRLLKAQRYRLRVNSKQLTGKLHPDRHMQFRHIHEQRAAHLAAQEPVISVDTKKKELIGNFKQAGRVWGTTPEQVNVHDFKGDALGRAVPYGIYELARNHGTVYVGESADTPSFAVENIAAWCEQTLAHYYPGATRLLIEADSGGSNSSRSRVWKQQLQEQVADRFGLTVTVCHYPPGASKWNPVEHRLFSEISKTWAGCPLRTWEVMLGYLAETRTNSGLQVTAQRVSRVYATGLSVSDEEMATLNVQPHAICPAWNYTIRPRSPSLAN
jgi:Rhodopirellula transposase DDE domain